MMRRLPLLLHSNYQSILSLFLFLQSVVLIHAFDTVAFDLVVEKLKTDIHEFAGQVEFLYESRCAPETLNSCLLANFGECQSEPYPQQECVGGPNYGIAACGYSEETPSCSGYQDFYSS